MGTDYELEERKFEHEVFEYLDNLREEGTTNMYGATPYIQDEFGIDKCEARELLEKWMRTFEERHSG